MAMASNSNVASVALCKSILNLSQSVGFRMGWDDSGVGEELQQC